MTDRYRQLGPETVDPIDLETEHYSGSTQSIIHRDGLYIVEFFKYSCTILLMVAILMLKSTTPANAIIGRPILDNG